MERKKNQKRRGDSRSQKYDKSYNQAMEKSYESILFLGTSLFSNEATFNINFLSTYILVMKYFIDVKDFDKVDSIVELLLLKDEKKKVNIDCQILEEVCVSLN